VDSRLKIAGMTHSLLPSVDDFTVALTPGITWLVQHGGRRVPRTGITRVRLRQRRRPSGQRHAEERGDRPGGEAHEDGNRKIVVDA
jgi:hypothetical protein